MLVAAAGVACGSVGSVDDPEGRIAFAIELNDAWRLVTANADGSGDLTVLRSPSDYRADAAWSPDGKKIAYSDVYVVEVMNADGTGLRQVVGGDVLRGLDTSFAWSPDGGEIAILNAPAALYVVHADGANLRLIVRCRCVPGTRPAWSPDGRMIAYAEWVGARGIQIRLVNLDGTDKRALTRGGEASSELSWSPDGSQIAFTRAPIPYVVGSDGIERENPAGPVMYVINGDGSGERRLGRGEEPAWSPDGTRIAFTRRGRVRDQ
jgi:Tol biopolymer transport system component